MDLTPFIIFIIKKVENRNEQFEKIAKLKLEYMQSDNPVVSIDAKNAN
jgi:hypothetical protein